MKKIYSLFVVLALAFVSFAAQAFEFTLNIDNANAVSVQVNWEPVSIVNGENTFTGDDASYTTVYVSQNPGYGLNSVSSAKTGTSASIYSGGAYIYPTADDNVWNVLTYSYADVRNAQCTIEVDDATKAKVTFNTTWEQPTLVNGVNTVKFSAELESPFTIESTSYNTPLYKVEKNGAEVESDNWGNYAVEVANGDNIKIYANFPDTDYPVNITYGEGAEGFVTDVKVNGVSVADVNKFTAKAGSKVEIYGNTTDYAFEKMTINGAEVTYFYSPYSFTITKETNIVVNAHKYSTIKAILNVDDPTNFVVYKGYQYQNNPINVVAGKNEIELPENNNKIQVVANSGCFITSITDGVKEYKNDYQITLTDGMELTILSGKIVRDKKFVLYVDDLTAANHYYSFSRTDRSSVDITSGYNTIEFSAEADCPFQLGWAGSESVSEVYVNNVAAEPIYAGGSTFEIRPNDGDVIKAYMKAKPALHTVTFSHSVDVGKVQATVDKINKLDLTTTESIQVLTGTEIDFNCLGYIVKVNDEETTESETGEYKVVVTGDTKIHIEGGAGVDSITVDTPQDNNVYNLQGVMVIENASADDINNLAKGVYIINHKKVIK